MRPPSGPPSGPPFNPPPGLPLALVAVAIGASLLAFGLPSIATIWLATCLVLVSWRSSSQRELLSRWLDAPGTELPDGQGRWRSIFERLSRQARENREARGAAAAEIERLHAAVDLLPDALVVLERDNSIQWLNRAASDLLGPMIAHRPVEHFIREPEFLRYLAGGDFKAPVHLPLANRPGRMFAMRLVPTPDRWRLLILRDITQQHQVEAMRRDFVANVSHEIRTPLTVISGFIDTLIDLDLPRDQQLLHLRSARKQSATMERLLTDLLTLSSLESKAPVDTYPVSLRPLLEAQVADARALSAGRHLITLTAPRDVRLTGVASEIETALRNLLTNAVRYTPEGGSITVALDADPGRPGARIQVSDSGIGIAREHLPRITERFYRVDRGRSRETGGTGLGLAIVKHVVQRHDAGLEIESTPGRGSTFTIVLPSSRLEIGATAEPLTLRSPGRSVSGTP